MRASTGPTILFWLWLCGLVACRQQADPAPTTDPEPAYTDRIAVPESVRRNLGIDFVAVERRRVAQTLRLPGHFELLPSARHEHRVPIAGRVDPCVEPLQRVEKGEVLYRIDSPEWRRVQKELGDLSSAVQIAQARIRAMQPLVAAHAVHEQSLRDAITVMEARVVSLDETRATVGGQAQELAAARVQLAQVRAEVAEAVEKRAETDALLGELQASVIAGQDRSRLALDAAAALLGVPAETMREAVDAPSGTVPPWRTIAAIEVRATAAGIVDRLPVAHGVWIEAGELVLTITDLARVRFRARGLQSDLSRLHSGLPATVVLPPGGGLSDQRIEGTLALGVEADPVQRTIDAFMQLSSVPPWARPGIAGFLEVETLGGSEPELAVPLSAVLHDGLERVLFRRDPADPDKVIRLQADLGIDDGLWVEVKSGIRDGDQIVLAGAYELMLASSGSAAKGGHFHADGTFHEGQDK